MSKTWLILRFIVKMALVAFVFSYYIWIFFTKVHGTAAGDASDIGMNLFVCIFCLMVTYTEIGTLIKRLATIKENEKLR